MWGRAGPELDQECGSWISDGKDECFGARNKFEGLLVFHREG